MWEAMARGACEQSWARCRELCGATPASDPTPTLAMGVYPTQGLCGLHLYVGGHQPQGRVLGEGLAVEPNLGQRR